MITLVICVPFIINMVSIKIGTSPTRSWRRNDKETSLGYIIKKKLSLWHQHYSNFWLNFIAIKKYLRSVISKIDDFLLINAWLVKIFSILPSYPWAISMFWRRCSRPWARRARPPAWTGYWRSLAVDVW